MAEASHAVFLSYASEDADAALRIAEALRAAGVEVWFDREELRGGDAWDQSIRRQIKTCALFIPIISKHTHERAEGYFRLEWKLAVDRSHLIASDKAFLVPVVIDDTPDDDERVPERFREVQWTRLPNGETTPAFIRRITTLLGAAAPPGTASTAGPTKDSAGLPRKPARRAGWTGVALLVLAVASGGGWFAWRHFGTHTSSALPATSEKSIAVLPFTDLSEKHDQEYLADGMAEEVIDLLANVPGLKVIGRTSSFQFKGKNEDLRKIGSELGARYVVEGSVRRSGDRMRVTAQLIDAADGSHLWSDTYEHLEGDSFQVQDQIASGLARALQVTVGADLPERPYFASTEAYDLYLRGRHAFDRQDKEGLESAAAYFQQALELDPTSVSTYAWLAAAQEASAEYGFAEPRTGYERARISAQHALSLDPKAYLPYVVLTGIELTYDWDWAAAERDAKEAVRLKPRDPYAIGGVALVDATLGRWDESARLFETAIGLDPLYAPFHMSFANVLWATGRLQECEAETRKALQISPTYNEVHSALGATLLLEGKFDAALTEMQQEPSDASRGAGLAMAYHAMGREAESEAALARVVQEHAQDDAYEIGDAYAYRGELDQAFSWLDRAYRQKDPGLYLIKQDAILKNLWGDPRYKDAPAKNEPAGMMSSSRTAALWD